MTLVARAAVARLAVAGTALACLTMLVGGCGTATGSSASPAGTTPAVSPSGSGSPPASSPASSAGAPSPARTLTAPPAYGTTNGDYPCPASFVQVTLGSAQAAGGTTLQVIDFTNRGDKLCSLGGSPGVSLAGGTPLAQIGLAAPVPATLPPGAVPLNPGQVANSLLQISHASNYPKATCDPVHARYLVIAVPNDTGFVKLAYDATACAKPIQILSVSPIARGSGT